MSWKPITIEELKELGTRINSEYVSAPSIEELYGKLNDYKGYVLLRAPSWCGDLLVTLVVKPRTE